MSAKTPMQSLLKPIDDAFGVKPPPRFAETLDDAHSGIARCGQTGVRSLMVGLVTQVVKDQKTLLMIWGQHAVRRNLAEGSLEQSGKGDLKAKGTIAAM